MYECSLGFDVLLVGSRTLRHAGTGTGGGTLEFWLESDTNRRRVIVYAQPDQSR